MTKFDRIPDPVASDEWRFRKADGQVAVARIEIGRPQIDPNDKNGDWFCPVYIEGFNERIMPIFGVGPVDALMNAMSVIRKFADQIGEFAPRAAEHGDSP